MVTIPDGVSDGNQIAFVYKGDIYTVGVDGGDAKATFQSKMDLQLFGALMG